MTFPLLACGTDLPPVPSDTTTTGGSSTTGDPTITTIDPEATDTEPDATTQADTDGTTGVDSTGETTATVDSSSGDPDGTSSSGDPPPVCGDGMIEADREDCDGEDLGGQTCDSVGMGFTDGALACAGDCTFDVSACTTCGDRTVETGEDCDGVDLGGQTCDSIGMGFVDGTLACAGDCTFDVSACNTCGNAVVDAGEDCDGADLGGQTCADLGMGFTGGGLACDDGCAFDSANCTSLPWPTAGEVVITEIMQNPSVLLDTEGEWFEVYNPTMGTVFQLGSCTIDGNMSDTGFTVQGDLTIGPMEYRVFSVDFMGDQGFVPDYQWPGADFGLNNGSDEVRLSCNGMMVDQVQYDGGATFPDPNGQSMSLDPAAYDAIANDMGASWCPGSISYNGDFGTPGADNPSCGGPNNVSIDFCRLQFPTLIDEFEGTDVEVFGRLFVAGLSDTSGGNDPAPSVIGFAGFGPDGTDPAVDPGWTWTAGFANPGYGPASPNYEANNDEYTATISVPSPPGNYDFAFRFTGDSAATFTYCDGGPAGSSDGYAAADAGQMNSSAPPPPPPMYFSEYVEGSGNSKAVEIYNPPGADADLATCAVQFYFNENVTVGNTVNLGGVLPAGNVLVVCDDGISDPTDCDVLAPGTFFNGNDSVELICGATVLDVIGQIGGNPAGEWNMGGVGTQNETLRRNCAVMAGDTDGSDPFDPSLEWTSFMQDDFTDLGQYICP
ncbi:MAG: hypothetical protein K0V04_26320 [Deltaproteobacteria bacterium]|nr:hypothetical protein [Deltaproteobacteria bacterium]